MRSLTTAEIEDLAMTLYGACFDRYDRHREPFADPRTGRLRCRDLAGAWSWLSEQQREMNRDKARAAFLWLSRREARDAG